MEYVDIRVPVVARHGNGAGRYLHWHIDVPIRRISDEHASVVAKFAKHEYRAFEGRLWARQRRNPDEVYHDEGIDLASSLVQDGENSGRHVMHYPFLHEAIVRPRDSTLDPRTAQDLGPELDAEEEHVRGLAGDLLIVDDAVWCPTMGPAMLVKPWNNTPAKHVDIQFVPDGYALSNPEECICLFSVFDETVVRDVLESSGRTAHVVTVEPKVLSREGWSISDCSRFHADAMLRRVFMSMVEATANVPMAVGGRAMVELSMEMREASMAPVEERLGMARRFLDLWPSKGYADAARDRRWSLAVETMERLDLRPVKEAESLAHFSI